MYPAVKSEGQLGCPLVGTWQPKVPVGTILSEGMLVGHIVRLGKPEPVVVPAGIHGVIRKLTKAGTWTAYGDAILAYGAADGMVVEDDHHEAEAGGVEGAVAIRADTDGTVYLRPEPGAAPFAAPGQKVAAHDTLALVEVMKTFTPVRCPIAGEVVRVDVDDSEAVEEGQTMFWIKPD